jgi:glycosyltransferase involved in cell wall biosynthesis
MSKKNILFFDLAGYDFPGGCEKYFSNFAKHTSEEHNVSIVISPQYKKFMDIIYRIVTGRKINSLKPVGRDIGKAEVLSITFNSLIPFSQTRRSMRKTLLSFHSIYAKNEFQELAYLYLQLGKKEYAKRVVVGVHTPLFLYTAKYNIWRVLHEIEYQSPIYKAFLLHARLIHVNNSDYKELIIKKYGVSGKRVLYIPNFIDWKPVFEKTTKKTSFNLLWLGRFTKEKGIDRLEEVIDNLSKKTTLKNIKLVVGGSGEEEVKVKSLENKYQLVEYKGFIKNVAEEYKKADVVLFTAYFDTFAYAVLEPLSYGVPVVSFNIPGPKDMITSGQNGYLVTSEADFITGLEKLYSLKIGNIKEFNTYKENIYTKTNKTYNSKKIFSQLDTLFI